MIKRENLKKGDHVLQVATSYAPRDTNHATEMIVVSIGSKYIGCQAIYNGEPFGQVKKYHNDEYMGMTEWSQWKLFLGTKEEYLQEVENRKKCNELRREVDRKIGSVLDYEKLLAIKTIIEADSVDDALAKMHCVRLPK